MASKDYATQYEAGGLASMSAQDQAVFAAQIARKVQNGTPLTDTEQRFLRETGGAAVGNRASDGRRAAMLADWQTAMANRAVQAEKAGLRVRRN